MTHGVFFRNNTIATTIITPSPIAPPIISGTGLADSVPDVVEVVVVVVVLLVVVVVVVVDVVVVGS